MAGTSTIDLTKELKRFFGFDTFKGDQKAIIQHLMAGGDTFVLMPTGGGKSLCYQLPALLLPGVAIVISPLIALMKNQVDAIRGYSLQDGVAHFLNSSLNKATINEVKADVMAGITKMLYVAPESLTKEENIEFLKGANVSFYAIDEAHCISEWGHDFRPEYRRIRPMVDEIGRAPIIALTATAPPKVQLDILSSLGIEDARIFKSSFNRPNLYYEVRQKTNATKDIIHILKNNPGKSAIVYCLSRRKVEEMTETLTINGIKAVAYHAGLDAATRAANQDAFLLQKADVVCATIAFGMGIDKPDVRFVFHYDIPKSLEGYYQETGRAGRDGGEGRCITFYSRRDVQKLEKFMQGKPLNEQEIGRQLIAETVAYAESCECRRRVLLSYFGEAFPQANCGNCDNCLQPRERFDAREAVALLIEVVAEFNDKYKPEFIVDFVMGTATDQLRSLGHAEHELFGKGSDHDRRFWLSVLRQCVVAGYISKDIENYGLLRVGPNAAEAADGDKPVMFCIDRDFSDFSDDDVASGPHTAALDEPLHEQLKGLRRRTGEKLGLPPHVIFSDQALEAMATFYPLNIEELRNIPGVGEGKAQKFGQPFAELIAAYVEQNEIERPLDSVVKMPVNKSKNKVAIIQAIDRKLPLDILADSKGLAMAELLKEMEVIVYSGTRLNIDYWLQSQWDREQIDDVFAYFKEADDDSLQAALDELHDEDYPEEMIRLVRIKFVSEMGN